MPGASFEPRRRQPTLSLRALLAGQVGLQSSLVQILVLALALEAVVLVTPFFMQWVVDGAIVSADRDLLLLLALGFGLLLLMQAGISAARSLVILHASTHLSLHWNAGLFAHLLHLPTTWFERRHVGDVVSRFGSLATLQRTLTTSFIESLLDGLMAAATLALMLFYSRTLVARRRRRRLLYALIRWSAYRPLRAAIGGAGGLRRPLRVAVHRERAGGRLDQAVQPRGGPAGPLDERHGRRDQPRDGGGADDDRGPQRPSRLSRAASTC